MSTLLQYDFRVIGANNVKNSLSSMERLFAQHNQKLARQLGVKPGARPGSVGSTTSRESALLARHQEAEAKRWQTLARRSADYRLREEIRAARSAESARMQGLRTEERARLRSIRTEEMARKRLTMSEYREASAVADRRSQFVRGTVGRGAGRVFGGLAGVGKVGGAMLGIGGAMVASSAVSGSVRMDEQARRLSIAGRGAGEAGLDPDEIRKRVVRASIASGISPEQMMAGVSASVAKTGDLQGSLGLMETAGTASMATGADVSEIFMLAADATEKFGLNAEQAKQAIALLAAQGKAGAFELKALSQQAPRVFAAAAGFGFKGEGGVRDVGGLLQIARSVTGSDEQAAFSTEAFLRQLTAKSSELASGKAFGGRKVDVFTDESKTRARDVREVIADTVTASRGNLQQLQSVFGEEGIRLARPFVGAYTAASEAAGGGEKGAAAGRAAVLERMSRSSDMEGNWAEVQRDASDAMKSTAVQLEMLNSKLADAIGSQLLPELQKLIPHLTALAPEVGKLVKSFVALANWLAENPFTGLGAAVSISILAEMAKAKIGAVVAGELLKIFARVPVPGGAPGMPVPGGVAVPGGPGGLGGKLARVGGTALRGVAGGAMGYATGSAIGQLAGGASGEETGSRLGAAVGIGAGVGGPVGALVGLSLGALYDSIDGLHTQLKSFDFGDDPGKTGNNPEVYRMQVEADNEERRKAAAEMMEAAKAMKEAAGAVKATAGEKPHRGPNPSPVKG